MVHTGSCGPGPQKEGPVQCTHSAHVPSSVARVHVSSIFVIHLPSTCKSVIHAPSSAQKGQVWDFIGDFCQYRYEDDIQTHKTFFRLLGQNSDWTTYTRRGLNPRPSAIRVGGTSNYGIMAPLCLTIKSLKNSRIYMSSAWCAQTNREREKASDVGKETPVI